MHLYLINIVSYNFVLSIQNGRRQRDETTKDRRRLAIRKRANIKNSLLLPQLYSRKNVMCSYLEISLRDCKGEKRVILPVKNYDINKTNENEKVKNEEKSFDDDIFVVQAKS